MYGRFKTLEFAAQVTGGSGSDIGLDDQRRARTGNEYRIGCPSDHIEHLVPLAFDRCEHGVSAMRQSGCANHLDCSGDGIVYESAFLSDGRGN